VLCAHPATARPAAALVVHPQDDWAGSQIERYEGGPAITRDESVDPGPGVVAGLDPADPFGPAPVTRPGAQPAAPPRPSGLDVSSHQGNVNWSAVRRAKASFAYVKATESTTYVNPYFKQQYNGAYGIGLVRGAYHFATPNTSTGAAQATYFVAHGGGWSNDGRTLPPALDLEYNPYGQQCYGMSQAALGAWVRQFVDTVHARTSRWPAIYTSTSWWSLCLGKNASFSKDPLWIARYNKTLGGLPPGWRTWAIWQFADSGTFPGDQDTLNGTMDQLRALAHG
jgi:GH25 family lysozyme M1 (1,4-beta-N-acetylmuramidase)